MGKPSAAHSTFRPNNLPNPWHSIAEGPSILQSIDRNLVERFKRGQTDAFNELYERMCPRIYRFGLRLSGCREDAEDIAVQTFAEAYRSRESYLERSSIETWLYRIAVFQSHRISRKKKPVSALDEEVADRSAEGSFGHIEIQQLIAELPDRQRIAFLLVKSEGLTYREAAEALDKPMGTVQSDVHEACVRLRKQLFSGAENADSRENYGYEV